ncbi:MAG: ABC transporter ATP-binding protein [Eubacteriales bacterium]|nr:ABC transporter ATP-binding protein [Eubacteriales bacterium]
MTSGPISQTMGATCPPEAAEQGLVVRELYKSYGRESVLRGVSFSLLPGSALGVCGSNGAGKTTLLHLLASVLKPDRGLITLFGIRARRSRAYRQKIGLVPQEIALSPRLTVRQNLEFWSSASGLKGQAREKAVEEAIRLTNIGAFQGKRVSRCSGGMCRRANLAAGLVGNPSLILLDEPTAGIDEENRDAVLRSVADLKKEGRMVIMVNHYHGELEAICDAIITLKDGRVDGNDVPVPKAR